jgi:hypothetical protein
VLLLERALRGEENRLKNIIFDSLRDDLKHYFKPCKVRFQSGAAHIIHPFTDLSITNFYELLQSSCILNERCFAG